jgi:eukaryotic-like serine/threonine-protein kinase
VPVPVATAVAGPQPDRTQVLSRAMPPVPPAQPAGSSVATPRRRGRLVPAVAALAATAAVLLIVWLLLSRGGPDEPDPGAGSPAPTAETSRSPRPSPKPTVEATPEVTAAGMESFVEDYLATVTTDPSTTWDLLTPQFQAESGNFGQYQKFWSDFQSADIASSQADPDTLQISYTVDYLHQDGSRSSDDVTLQLQGTDGDYLISGES